MKSISDVAVIVQARLGSQRVPNKMIRDFDGTTLVDIVLEKIKSSQIIPWKNLYVSVFEKELKEIANKHGANIFNRSEKSAKSEGNPITEIYEWHDKLPHKYAVVISACNPLLKIDTIDKFVQNFLKSDKDGSFAVFEKKTYYWDSSGKSITDWGGSTLMNTKFVKPVYEAAHCLYGSRVDIIKENFWMDTKTPAEPELFVMNELEAFDIDYEWQFKLGEQLYKMRDKIC